VKLQFRKGYFLLPIILLALVIIIVGSLFVFSASNKNSGKGISIGKEENAKESMDAVPRTPSVGSRYLFFEDGIIEVNRNKRRILYFYANWCPTCRPVDAEFMEEEGNIPEDVVVIRINYNDADTDPKEKELAKQYDISYQHTFVEIDSEGGEVGKWNGGGIDELLVRLR